MIKCPQNAKNLFFVGPSNGSCFTSPCHSFPVKKSILVIVVINHVTKSHIEYAACIHNQQRCQKTAIVKLKKSCPVHHVQNVPYITQVIIVFLRNYRCYKHTFQLISKCNQSGNLSVFLLIFICAQLTEF